MHPRAVCNIVYAHLIRNAQSDEDREKFEASLYEDSSRVRLVDQIGG